jgi:hypothetical protein
MVNAARGVGSDGVCIARGDAIDDDTRLDAYNAWLAQAAAHDRSHAPTQRPE